MCFTVVAAFGVIWAPLYGPLAALYCELFETRLRYTGISLVYQIGAVFSVSLTPLVATTLTGMSNGTPWLVASYIVVAGLVSAIGVRAMGKQYR